MRKRELIYCSGPRGWCEDREKVAQGEELTFSVLGDGSAALTWWLLGHQGDLAGSLWMESSTFKHKDRQQAIHCSWWLWEAGLQLVGKFVLFSFFLPLSYIHTKM